MPRIHTHKAYPRVLIHCQQLKHVTGSSLQDKQMILRNMKQYSWGLLGGRWDKAWAGGPSGKGIPQCTLSVPRWQQEAGASRRKWSTQSGWECPEDKLSCSQPHAFLLHLQSLSCQNCFSSMSLTRVQQRTKNLWSRKSHRKEKGQEGELAAFIKASFHTVLIVLCTHRNTSNIYIIIYKFWNVWKTSVPRRRGSGFAECRWIIMKATWAVPWALRAYKWMCNNNKEALDIISTE